MRFLIFNFSLFSFFGDTCWLFNVVKFSLLPINQYLINDHMFRSLALLN